MKRRSRRLFPLSPHAALPLLTASLFAATLLLLAAPAGAERRDADSELCDETEWGQTSFGDRGETVRDFQQIHEPAPRGTWHIDAGVNGSVQLSDWEKDEVLICVQVTAWSRKNKARAEQLMRSVHIETDGGRLRAEGPPSSKSEQWAVSYKIFTPREMDLDIDAQNGPISVEGIHGHMSLHTQNGPLRIVGAGGDIEGRTTNGPVTVTLTGSRWKGRGLDVETTNGPVHLSIPRRYSADLTTGTENGPMAGAFVRAGRSHGHRQVSTVIGSGGAPIRVVTSNGPVVVKEED